MKLIFCPYCQDMFKLITGTMRYCECRKVYGRYINNSEAEVSRTAVSVAIGNGSFFKTYLKFVGQDKTEDRSFYLENTKIERVWVHPNSGPGNPHTRIIENS